MKIYENIRQLRYFKPGSAKDTGRETAIQTAFTRFRRILKTVKNMTDRPPIHTKTAFLTGDFENGRFGDETLSGIFGKQHRVNDRSR